MLIDYYKLNNFFLVSLQDSAQATKFATSKDHEWTLCNETNENTSNIVAQHTTHDMTNKSTVKKSKHSNLYHVNQSNLCHNLNVTKESTLESNTCNNQQSNSTNKHVTDVTNKGEQSNLYHVNQQSNLCPDKNGDNRSTYVSSIK